MSKRLCSGVTLAQYGVGKGSSDGDGTSRVAAESRITVLHTPDVYRGRSIPAESFLRAGVGGFSQQKSQLRLQVCRALISRGSRKGRDWLATATALRGGPVTNGLLVRRG